MGHVRDAYRYFEQAIRDGSIRRAAENLNIASSAVNRQLLILEEEIGAPLFERLPRGIRPTAEGAMLLEYVRQWQRQDRRLGDDLAALRGGIRSTIRIAAAESVTEQVLPGAMMELRLQYPDVAYTLISGDNLRLASGLTSKEADVVIAFDVKDRVRAEVAAEYSSPLGVICAPDHPLAAAGMVRVADYITYPLVVPGDAWLENSGLTALIDPKDFEGRISARAERPGMLKAMVAAGIGIGLLTRFGVDRDIAEGRLAWIPLEPGIIRPAVISVLTPRDAEPRVTTRVFLEILRRHLAAALAREAQ